MYICKLYTVIINLITVFQTVTTTYVTFVFTIGFTEYTFVICSII